MQMIGILAGVIIGIVVAIVVILFLMGRKEGGPSAQGQAPPGGMAQPQMEQTPTTLGPPAQERPPAEGLSDQPVEEGPPVAPSEDIPMTMGGPEGDGDPEWTGQQVEPDANPPLEETEATTGPDPIEDILSEEGGPEEGTIDDPNEGHQQGQ